MAKLSFTLVIKRRDAGFLRCSLDFRRKMQNMNFAVIYLLLCTHFLAKVSLAGNLNHLTLNNFIFPNFESAKLSFTLWI